MNVEMLTMGPLFTNCYVVWPNNAEDAVVIDPGFDSREDAARISETLETHELRVKFILNTHGHPDHTSGNVALRGMTRAPILIHRKDAELATFLGYGFLENEGFVEFGEAALQVLHTPGHTPGSISLVGEGGVFTGDTLFAGSIGRTDLPGGSIRDIMKSLRKLAALPDSLRVYPGHGPCSEIGKEKNTNPFLSSSFENSLLR